jgi:putative ubiquitin-RnfH superfamily antitoxin RatB of RatAB toxin-antitoxin module
VSAGSQKPNVKLEAIELWPDQCWGVEFELPVGATLMHALEHLVALNFKPLVERLADHALTELVPGDIGVNGRRAVLGQVLLNHDRIEFYRPILADAKAARFEKVARLRKLARQQRHGKPVPNS